MDLQQYMTQQFNMAELEAIAHEVGINFARLRQPGKEATIANLIEKARQYGREPALIAAVKKRRPDYASDQIASDVNPPQPAKPPPAKSRPSQTGPQSVPTRPTPRPSTKPTKSKKDNITLQQFITNYFSLEELEALTLEIGVDFEQLAGRTKSGKVRELIVYMMRRRRLGELVTAVREARPRLDMSHVIMPDQSWLEKQKYSDRRIWLLGGVIALLILTIVSYAAWRQLSRPPEWATNELLPNEKFGIAVAEFAVGGDLQSGPQGREMSRQIYSALEQAINSRANLRETAALTRVQLIRNDREAFSVGQSVNADLVLWGWIPEFSEESIVHNFTLVDEDIQKGSEQLVESVNLMISGPNRIQMTQLSGRATALTQFVLGLIYLRGQTVADYQQSLALFETGIAELEADKSRLTALLDSTGTLNERLALEETLAALEKT
ncbi:MAG TPA: hypothetical protein PLK31_26735, partial [Chloroflexota bacterium]|nr:hypothetical protein [Chloroflexota bacterium]